MSYLLQSSSTLIISGLLIDMRSILCYKRVLNNSIHVIATLEQPVKTNKKILNLKRQALKE